VALRGILELGIRDVLARGRRELEAVAAEHGLPASDAADHLAQTLEAVPGLMVAIDAALRRPGVPGFARAMWLEVVSYLLLDADLIPAIHGDPVRGVLDDAYFLHRSAQELQGHLSMVDMRSVDGGAQLLRGVLPPAVADDLDRRVAALRTGLGDS